MIFFSVTQNEYYPTRELVFGDFAAIVDKVREGALDSLSANCGGSTGDVGVQGAGVGKGGAREVSFVVDADLAAAHCL